VILKHRDTTTGIAKFPAVGDFLDMQARMKTLQPLATYGGTQGTLFESDEPARVIGPRDTRAVRRVAGPAAMGR
jgi:hypothetical protein